MHHLLSCCICQSKKSKEKRKSGVGDDNGAHQQNNNELPQSQGGAAPVPTLQGGATPVPPAELHRSGSGSRSRPASIRSRQGERGGSRRSDCEVEAKPHPDCEVEADPPPDHQVRTFLPQLLISSIQEFSIVISNSVSFYVFLSTKYHTTMPDLPTQIH